MDCSHSLWREACAAYAVQLAEHDPIRSSSYHLMVGDVLEAISVLRKKQLFQVAVALARLVAQWTGV